MAYEIRPRSIVELIDATFQLYRNHFSLFFCIALAANLPVFLAVAIFSPWFLAHHPNSFFGQTGTSNLALMVGWATAVVNWFASFAMTAAVANIYVDRPISVGLAYKKVWQTLPALLWGGTLFSLGVGFASVLLIIPGVMVFFDGFLWSSILIVEESTARGALQRSSALMKGLKGRLAGLLSGIFVLNFVFYAGLAAFQLKALQGIPWAYAIAGQIPKLLLVPVNACASCLFYFDAVVRKESFDLEIMAERLEPAKAAPVTPSL